MDYFQRIQKTIDYIEDNLENKITLEELAEIAYLSKYYYHRLFTMYVGEPVMGYIRKRRLARAVAQLDSSESNILEIAIDNQFESQEVFTRAFTKYFEITPGKYRKLKSKIKLCDKVSVLGMKSKKRKDGIQPKLIIKEEMKLIGMKMETTFEENAEKFTIAHFHNDVFDPRINEIKSITDYSIKYGICESDLEAYEEHKIIHTACYEVSSADNIPEDMYVRILPPNKYLAFTHSGKIGSIADTFIYIFNEYLPNSDYELSKTGINLQAYKPGKISFEEDIEFDIYVPVE